MGRVLKENKNVTGEGQVTKGETYGFGEVVIGNYK